MCLNLYVYLQMLYNELRGYLTLNYVKLTTGWEPTSFLLTTIRLILCYLPLENTILLHLKLA